MIRRLTHTAATAPPVAEGAFRVSQTFKNAGINGQLMILGPAPLLDGRVVGHAWRCYFVLGVNEVGAGSSNFTAFEFRAIDNEDPTSYDALATLTTQDNPTAGKIVAATIRAKLVLPNRVLAVQVTRNGTGSKDLDLKQVHLGVDILGVRVA